MRSTFCLIIICLLTACSTVNYIGIESYTPAEITFPDNVKKVLIVNNAVPQPANSGYEYSFYGVAQDTCKAYADSALFSACRALGETLVEKDYFEDVLLYHEPTRTDNSFLADRKLTNAKVKSLLEETDADAIISFDRLLFRMKKNIMGLIDGFIVGTVDVSVSAVIRTYIPQRDNPLATVLVEDSIFWSESGTNLTLLHLLLPKPDDALRAAGEYIGSKVYPNFVPHWVNETRWYYTGFNTRWKEASAYASTGKWEKAIPIWERLYEKSSGWKDKAKAASNVALAYEIETELEKANEWANKSYELFQKNKGEDAKEAKLQKLYVEALMRRIQQEKKLNIQFGEE